MPAFHRRRLAFKALCRIFPLQRLFSCLFYDTQNYISVKRFCGSAMRRGSLENKKYLYTEILDR